MTRPGNPTLTTVNLGAPDPAGLAEFYRRLLGYEVVRADEFDVLMRDPGGGVALSFQHEPDQPRPDWPAGAGDVNMMMHLEIHVDDLATATAFAVECGATPAGDQPQPDVRVCLDPAGHPFCLWTG